MTERPRAPARFALGAADLKRYLLASLAAAYTLAWWSFGSRAPTAASEQAQVAQSPSDARQPAPRTAWYDELPLSQKPPVQLPAGWQIASGSAVEPVSTTLAPVPRRVTPARARRIRTRSS